jgi:hypothetical protein
MATFSQVKAILDQLVAGKDPTPLKTKHGGDAFRWDTADALRNAVVNFPKGQIRLIDPAMIANGKGAQTNLVRILSGPFGGYPQMPFRGTYATPAQIQTIQDWIDEGAKDSP